MKRLTFSCHFYKTEWTQERGNGEILWLEGKQLEAIKIQSDVDLIVEGWCPLDDAWMGPNEEGVTGVIGQEKGLSAIKIAAKEAGDASVYYRVYLRKLGWTDFYRDGVICGSSVAKSKNVIEGIQIFWMGINDNLEIRIKAAERKLSEYIWVKTHIFIRNPEEMLLASTKSYLNGKKSEMTEVEWGVILPPKKDDSTSGGSYVGGVLDEDLNWVAGHERNRNKNVKYTCIGGYEVDELDIRDSREEVIFGGIFVKSFGLLFTECLSRLWYIAANETNLRIAILTVPEHEDFFHEFTQLLGIEDYRLLVVDKPTRFAKVYVPDQTVRIWSDFRREYITVYNKILENVTPGKEEKLYLTRSVLRSQDGINEHFLERFYAKRGFKIVVPEKYKIYELVSLMSGAKEVVCTEGTLPYLGLFCRKGTSFTIFRRTDESIQIPQLIINQARGLKVTYIDATHNFLPVKDSESLCLYGPTPFFVEYLKANQIEYSEEELTFDIGDFCNKYIKMWFTKYSDPQYFKSISDNTLADVMLYLNREYGNGELNKRHYVTQAEKRLKKYKLRNIELKKEILELKEKLKELEDREVEFKKREAELKKSETTFKKREAELKKYEAKSQKREAESQKQEAEFENRDNELEKYYIDINRSETDFETELKKTATTWKPNRKRRRKLRQYEV